MGLPGPVLIPSGIYSAQASEILTHQRFRDFIEELRTDYDWIVIDSPPVLPVLLPEVLPALETDQFSKASALRE